MKYKVRVKVEFEDIIEINVENENDFFDTVYETLENTNYGYSRDDFTIIERKLIGVY